MSALSDSLAALHSLLRQLAESEKGLAEGPRAVALSQKQVTAAEQQIEQQKQTIKTTRKNADELNLKLKTHEASLKKLEGQLNAAASNKEYEIFKGQIENGKKERGTLEESAFAAMEEIDAAQMRLKELEAELVAKKRTATLATSEIEAKRPELENAVASLNAQIAEAEKIIPGDQKANYLRLRKAHGPEALSPLEDDFCSVCNGRVINQDLVRMRMNEFMTCRSCGRVLYHSG